MSQMDWRQALLRWRIQFKRGTSEAWASANTVLLLAELGWDVDLLRFKIGDGVTPWNELAWASLDPVQLAQILALLEDLDDLDDARITDQVEDVDSDTYAAIMALIEARVSMIDGGTP